MTASMTVTDMCRAAGITYRQLDTWTRLGYLTADNPTPGSGYARTWPSSEWNVARLMRMMTEAGILASKASPLARWFLQDRNPRPVELAPDLWLVLLPTSDTEERKRST